MSVGLPVYQPVTLRDEAALDLVKGLAPELTVVAAYGKLLPEAILAVPPLGSINVHSSLLPKYRGAAPINWAILNGEETTGVSIMYMAKALDAGDVILQKSTPIGPDEDAPALTVRLRRWGGGLSETVAAIGGHRGPDAPERGGDDLRPHADKRDVRHGLHPPRPGFDCQVRGLIPWPCAQAEIAGTRFKVFRTAPGGATDKAPGTLLSAGKQGIEVACGNGRSLYLTEIQAEGGKRMSAAAYLLGHPLEVRHRQFHKTAGFCQNSGIPDYGPYLGNLPNEVMATFLRLLQIRRFSRQQYLFPAADPGVDPVRVGPGSGVRQLPRYNAVMNWRCITGAQTAEAVLRPTGHSGCLSGPAGEIFSDHYDPRDNTIYLSEDVYGAATVAAVGVAAHEAGHAVQYAVGYGPVRLRTAIIPATQLGSRFSFILLFIGLVLYSQSLFLAGIILFGLTTFFQLATLPVEFNAPPGPSRPSRARACWTGTSTTAPGRCCGRRR